MIGTYERISMNLLKHQIKTKPFARFENGKLIVGTASKHLSKASRNWRLFWRIKRVGRD